MSIVLKMLHLNYPLANWREFTERAAGCGFAIGKNPEKTARAIFNQMSHENVVELMATEYEKLPDQVKLEFRELCSRPEASGNVRKNVQRLNKRLNGKLLREEYAQTANIRKETHDGVKYVTKKVNPAVAGAKRKYGIVD